MPIDCLNTISCIKKIGRVQSAALIRCFALTLTLGSAIPSAVAQPPAPGTENMAYHLPEVDAEWNRLRDEVGTLEFTKPNETIERYQKFYEQRGLRSLTTAVKISTVIAQIYWQQLGNHAKALEIYDWMIGKFGDMPHMARLQKERDDIANAPGYGSLVDAKLVSVGVPANNTQLTPVKLNGPVSSPTAVGVSNLTIAIPPIGSSQTAPGSVTVNNSMGALPGGLTVKAGQAGGITFPATVGLSVPSNNQIPSVNQGIVVPENKSFFLGTVAPVNPRLASLSGYLAQWKSGQMTWEQMVESSDFTDDDIKLLAAAPKAVSMYSNGLELREKLGGLIQKFPELTQDWAELPVPAQIVLAEAYTRQKNPLAKEIYLKLLDQDTPPGAWWNKELITYRLGSYYVALGDYIKAAEINLKIAEFTTNNAWHDDSLVEAARYYGQAGLEEKAIELYKRAQNGTYAWGIGLAVYDQASMLIAKGKYEEARKLLTLPIRGALAEDAKVGLLHLLALSYYRDNDYEKAEEYAQQTLNQYNSLKNPLKNEGIEDSVRNSENMLLWTTQWKKKPLVMDSELSMFVNEVGKDRVRLSVQSSNPVPLTVSVDDSRVKVKVGTQVSDHYLYSMRNVYLELSPGVYEKDFTASLTINSPDFPHFKSIIPIHIKVNSDVQSSPRNIFFGLIEAGKESTVGLKLTSRTAFRIIEVETDNKDMEVNYDVEEKEKNHDVKVKFFPNTPGKIRKGTIRFITDSPVKKIIELPYIARVE